jgi:hypothetical protein
MDIFTLAELSTFRLIKKLETNIVFSKTAAKYTKGLRLTFTLAVRIIEISFLTGACKPTGRVSTYSIDTCARASCYVTFIPV